MQRENSGEVMKASIVAFALLGACAFSTASTGEAQSGEPAVKTGTVSAPVSLKYEEKDRATVTRGSYIVNALGGCVSCHTMPTFQPGGDPFKGEDAKLNTKNYLAGGKCFGPTRSPNITPDDAGHPGGLSLADFIKSIRTGKVHMMEDGKKPDPNDIQKVMPWPEFREMTGEDLRAVHAYLAAVPHAEPSNTKCPPPPRH
jgi:mono/diheme cytochrome c family protein